MTISIFRIELLSKFTAYIPPGKSWYTNKTLQDIDTWLFLLFVGPNFHNLNSYVALFSNKLVNLLNFSKLEIKTLLEMIKVVNYLQCTQGLMHTDITRSSFNIDAAMLSDFLMSWYISRVRKSPLFIPRKPLVLKVETKIFRWQLLYGGEMQKLNIRFSEKEILFMKSWKLLPDPYRVQ